MRKAGRRIAQAFAVLAFMPFPGSLAVAAGRPEPVYTVTLEARFDPGEHRIEGREHLQWCNTSDVDVHELHFHLYLNAFRNDRSTFMRESGGMSRGFSFREGEWGWIEVRSMRLADGTDLKPGETFIQPDDGNADDRTVAVYPLPDPLPPGEMIDLDIAFECLMPAPVARTGVHGDYVLAGQWYPKIGVFEDSGVRGRAEPGWNCHQFHADSEFYADFGDYELRLDLPAAYSGRVGATGRLIDETVEDDRVRLRFVQQKVHDAAWTADTDFVLVEERFDPERDVAEGQRERMAALLGLPPESLALTPVEIRLLLQPAHRSQAGRYIRAAKAALRGYGLRLGAYPYATMTLVDPERGAGGSGGMEYPTFVTLFTHPAFQLPPLKGVRLPEEVTVHEVGHNFWQGLVASNEFEDPWLDEGVNSYYDHVVMTETYGPNRILGVTVSEMEMNRAQLGPGRYSDPIDQPAWCFFSGGSYGFHVFSRGSLTLLHMEGLLGPETFHRGMRRFFQQWRFGHPTTADFEAAIEQVAGEDLGWFFDQALRSTRHLDYAVRRVTSEKVKPVSGWFGEGEERRLLKDGKEEDADGATTGETATGEAGTGLAETDEASAGEAENDLAETAEAAAGEAETDAAEAAGADAQKDDAAADDTEVEVWRSEISLGRWGEFRHPVVVELRYADGSSERRCWDGQARWVRWTVEGPARLESAEIDPDHLMALEVNRLNNSRRVEARKAPRMKLMVQALFWLQNLFEAVSILG